MKNSTIFQIIRISVSVAVFYIGWAMRSDDTNTLKEKAYGAALIAASLFGIASSIWLLFKESHKPPAVKKK